MTTTAPGLLLICHGSRSPAGVAQAHRLADQVGALAPGLPLAAGFIELAQPDLDQALDRLVAPGAAAPAPAPARVIGVPLVLLGAGHLKTDGPAALARGRHRHPGATLAYARDLGIHPLVLAVAEERIRATLARLPPLATGPREEPEEDTAVVLVGRGSTDPDANADLYKVGRLLADSRGLPPVEPAFVSLAPPSVPAALDRCRRLGARRVAVVPYFLFTGILVERIARQASAWAADHPRTSVAVGAELGPDVRLARLVLERYEEARRGEAVMNCDCCLYRTPLPGYDARVGTPRAHTGHHH